MPEKAQLILVTAFACYHNKLYSLPKIKYKNHEISYNAIHKFIPSSKSHNDDFNLQRELVIASLINGDVSERYFDISPRWAKMRNGVLEFVRKLVDKCYPNEKVEITTLVCEHKAGRKNNNDLEVTVNETLKFRLEFKFNTKSVNGCPQFVSPCRPSVFLDRNFEEWYYDNYLPEIADFGGLEMPDRDTYLSTINNNKVQCMNKFKEKYNSDRQFNKFCKKVDKKAIKQFIQISNLNSNDLTEYLQTSQRDKHYMCYCDGEFFYDKLDESLYKLDATKSVEKEPTNYIVSCENGAKLEVKLRFKNGCGLQFPAFQIKRKIPTKKALIELGAQKKIKINQNMRKDDIVHALDFAGIVY